MLALDERRPPSQAGAVSASPSAASLTASLHGAQALSPSLAPLSYTQCSDAFPYLLRTASKSCLHPCTGQTSPGSPASTDHSIDFPAHPGLLQSSAHQLPVARHLEHSSMLPLWHLPLLSLRGHFGPGTPAPLGALQDPQHLIPILMVLLFSFQGGGV